MKNDELHLRCLLMGVFLLSVEISVTAQGFARSETCLTRGSFDHRYASYSPNGELIAFEANEGGKWDVYTMSSSGDDIQKITNNSFENRRPSWHPNGEELLYETIFADSVQLRSTHLETKQEKIIMYAHPKGSWIFASYDSTGERIACSLRETNETSHIVVIQTIDYSLHFITTNSFRNFYPKWSSVNNKLVFFSRKDTDNSDDEIYKIDLQTGEEERLTDWPTHNFCPSWSPSGDMIAYVTSMTDRRPEIYIMNSDGSNQRRITNNEDGDTLPYWHPIQKKLLITGYRNGNFQICELTLD